MSLVALTYDPSTWGAGQEDSGFKASLSHKVRPCLATKPQPRKMEHIKDSRSFPKRPQESQEARVYACYHRSGERITYRVV